MDVVELSALKMSELKRRAIRAGATADRMDAVDDHDDPRQAIVSLVVELESLAPVALDQAQISEAQELQRHQEHEAAMAALKAEMQTMVAQIQEEAQARALALVTEAEEKALAAAQAASETEISRVKAEERTAMHHTESAAAAAEGAEGHRGLPDRGAAQGEAHPR